MLVTCFGSMRDGAAMRRARRVEQARIPARRDQSGKQARIGSAAGWRGCSSRSIASGARPSSASTYAARSCAIDRSGSSSSARRNAASACGRSPAPPWPPHLASSRRVRPRRAHAGAYLGSIARAPVRTDRAPRSTASAWSAARCRADTARRPRRWPAPADRANADRRRSAAATATTRCARSACPAAETDRRSAPARRPTRSACRRRHRPAAR